MSGINVGKVITGGLLAGLVFNVLDFLNNYLIVGEDFRANATRLGLDPAVAESTTGIATWVAIDFLMGILVVWTYAAIRPRFGAGPKTAIMAGLIPWFAIALVLFGLATGGLMLISLWMKMTVITLVITSLGAVAGAWAYKEG
jgi:hypothetical protein